ncbi:MAG: cyclic nucleotide-binding domain-containing protein [Candidatus Latescibacteria bacterium]|nr:cyclic nucleotide-binding domain-containing protein [Candidatus Latescibacterota bacterium]
MLENRRSGEDRRHQNTSASKERRHTPDRRALLKDPEGTMQRIKNIDMFKGLKDGQLRKMVSICAKKNYPSQHQIYTVGEESNDMFILFKGKISIAFNSGVEVQDIAPTGTVGEMGVFTGEPRSASVVANTDCIALVFSKTELFRLFKGDTELWIKILMNIIKSLSHKLRKDNQVIEELMYRVRSLEIL